MGLIHRHGRPYSYRSYRRPDGKVGREYQGSGKFAELMEALAARARARHDLEQETKRAEEEAWFATRNAEEQTVIDAFEAVEAFTIATLEAAGYHRPRRGRWRKKRLAGPSDPRCQRNP
jgi:hypothetical protein